MQYSWVSFAFLDIRPVYKNYSCHFLLYQFQFHNIRTYNYYLIISSVLLNFQIYCKFLTTEIIYLFSEIAFLKTLIRIITKNPKFSLIYKLGLFYFYFQTYNLFSKKLGLYNLISLSASFICESFS